MPVPPELIVAGATVIGSAFTAIYLNRRRINEVRAWAWGRERDETDAGVAGDHRTLNEQIDSIETKLDHELEERRREHVKVEQEVRQNRANISGSIENLANTLNHQLPEADIDVDENIAPDLKHQNPNRSDDHSTDD